MKKLKPTIAALLLLSMFIIDSGMAFSSDANTLRRLSISAAIFPRIVGVDLNLENKLDKDNNAKLIIIYTTNKSAAVKIKQIIHKKVPHISGHKVTIELLPVDRASAETIESATGLFLAEPLEQSAFRRINQNCINKSRVCFSPFPGDVENGMLAGIYIGAQIRPFFNKNSLKKSNINVNPVLLKASRTHE